MTRLLIALSLLLTPSLVRGETLDLLDSVEALETPFREVRQIVVSADGDNAYVISDHSRALSVLDRDPTTGELSLVEIHSTAYDGIAEILEMGGVAVSPDGENVYVTGRDLAPSFDTFVVTFTRDPATGRLTFLGAVTGIPGLIEPLGRVVVSPDGDHVYVTGENTVAAFSRGVADGSLTWVESERDGLNGVDGLAGAGSLEMSSDGDHLCVLGVDDDSVAVFSRSESTGELTYVEHERNNTGGVTSMLDPNGLALSADGDFLYVAVRGSDALVVFERDSIGGALSFSDKLTLADDSIAKLENAHRILISGDGDFAYLAGSTGLATFSRNSMTGALTLQSQTTAGSSLSSLALSPSEAHLYWGRGKLVGNSLRVFERNASTGELTVAFDEDPQFGPLGLIGLKSLATSAAGDFLFAVSNPQEAVLDASSGAGALTVWRRDSLEGGLELHQQFIDGEAGVSGMREALDVTLSADGEFLYIAGNELAIFDRDLGTGDLTFTGATSLGGTQNLSIAVASDGSHAYSGMSDRLLAWSRDEMTGVLTPAFEYTNVGGDSLLRVVEVLVSPDNLHVYALSRLNDFIAVFERDLATGGLTFVESKVAPEESYLNDPTGMVLSPDGQHLYITSGYRDAVSAYSRDAMTGELTRVAVYSDRIGDVDFLDGPTSVAVSPSGGLVYVASEEDDAVALFARNETNGKLTFVESRSNGDADMEGLFDPAALLVSPDDRHLYVASSRVARVSVGRILVLEGIDDSLFVDGFETGDVSRWDFALPPP